MQPHTLGALGIALSVAATPATGQEGRGSPPGDFTGERVTVTLEGPRQSLRGRLVSFDSATLTVEFPSDSPGGGSTLIHETVPTGRVRQIDVEKRDPIWNGALLGAVVMVVCAATWCQQGMDGPSGAADVIASGAMGALLGGGIDALSRERKTIYKARPAPRKPGASNVQLSFSIKF
jgi:hypothetical protein